MKRTIIASLLLIACAASLLAQSPTPIDPKQRETALMQVKDTYPERAKRKMDELIAMGVPIKKSVQDAVNAAQPLKPTPTPKPYATPVGDGLGP